MSQQLVHHGRAALLVGQAGVGCQAVGVGVQVDLICRGEPLHVAARV
jgi:hypothetical protein